MKKNDHLDKLIAGYQEFHRDYTSERYDAYRQSAAEGQSPKVMVIACSDARVNPSIVTQAALGDIFLVSNVANIVPPYKPGKDTHHSTSSALEFAVGTLKVDHIVVMGHSGCGGIRALLGDYTIQPVDDYSFIRNWVKIIAAAGEKVAGLPEPHRHDMCEREALKISLANLRSFPWIREKIEEGLLQIHAWHFDIPSGELTTYDAAQDRFIPI